MAKDWLEELNELDDRYQYIRSRQKLWRSYTTEGRIYENEFSEDEAQEHLKELKYADTKSWLQENLSQLQQLQLLWVLQANPLDITAQIMTYKLTEIAHICNSAFGIAPEGEE